MFDFSEQFQTDAQNDQQGGFRRVGDSPALRRALDSLRAYIQTLPLDTEPRDVLSNEQMIQWARVRAAHIPPALAHCDFSNYQPLDRYYEGFMASNERWAADYPTRRNLNRCNLLISGGTGIGKSHMAVSIAKFIIREYGTRVRFVDCTRLMSDLRGNWGDDGLGEYLEHDCLILDDLGAEQGNSTQSERMIVLLRERMSNQRPTIITTNLQFPGDKTGGMAKYLSDRITSRMAEFYEVAQVTRITDDYRQRYR